MSDAQPAIAFNPPLAVDVNFAGINGTLMYAVCGDQALVRIRQYGEWHLRWVALTDVSLGRVEQPTITYGPPNGLSDDGKTLTISYDTQSGDFIH